MLKILLGTNNSHKITEFQQIFASVKEILFVSPREISLDLDVDETGSSYQENAVLKSETFAAASGLITLADDSGLEVNALNGAPGIYSARYGNLKQGTDKQRRDLLVQNLMQHPRPWTARFRCSIAISIPASHSGSPSPYNNLTKTKTRVFNGVCPGKIVPDERGTGGFGYDPIFELEGRKHTMAELNSEEKNLVSHRGLAGQAAIPFLRELAGV